MRNHYDLGRRRTDPPGAATESEGGSRLGDVDFLVDFRLHLSLLLGTGTAVYAISAFSSPPPVPKSGAALTNGTEDPVDGAGDEAAGFPISERRKRTRRPSGRTRRIPPPLPAPRTSADAQKPKRRRPLGHPLLRPEDAEAERGRKSLFRRRIPSAQGPGSKPAPIPAPTLPRPETRARRRPFPILPPFGWQSAIPFGWRSRREDPRRKRSPGKSTFSDTNCWPTER